MRYERFEDLPVWQAAVDLAAGMFRCTAQDWFRGKGIWRINFNAPLFRFPITSPRDLSGEPRMSCFNSFM